MILHFNYTLYMYNRKNITCNQNNTFAGKTFDSHQLSVMVARYLLAIIIISLEAINLSCCSLVLYNVLAGSQLAHVGIIVMVHMHVGLTWSSI